MSESLRQGQFSGTLVRNAEFDNKGGYDKLKFTIAVERWVKKDSTADNSMYVQCTLFGKRASSLEDHLKKGTTVIVSGSLWATAWTSKGGDPMASIQCEVSQFAFQRSPSSEKPVSAAPKRQASAPKQDEDNDDDVPF